LPINYRINGRYLRFPVNHLRLMCLIAPEKKTLIISPLLYLVLAGTGAGGLLLLLSTTGLLVFVLSIVARLLSTCAVAVNGGVVISFNVLKFSAALYSFAETPRVAKLHTAVVAVSKVGLFNMSGTLHTIPQPAHGAPSR
jgi:hypothetical protein